MAAWDDTLFATDEDVASRAIADFARLLPRSQRLADGTDGVVPALGYTLSSATNDFGDRGIVAQHVVRILEKKIPGATQNSPSVTQLPEDLLAVGSVSGTTLTLRRFGYPAGEGDPVGATTDATGVSFEVPTARRAISDASAWLSRLFNITSKNDLAYPEDLRNVCVLKTLTLLYAQAGVSGTLAGTGQQKDLNLAKYDMYRKELNEELTKLFGWYAGGAARRRPTAGLMTDPDDWRVPPSTF